jgi:hypothetical protein
MIGQSFIDFLKEQEGKADRQKVLALSALVGSSVLAQLMFAGVTQAVVCPGTMPCTEASKQHCEEIGCTWYLPCSGGLGTCEA